MVTAFSLSLGDVPLPTALAAAAAVVVSLVTLVLEARRRGGPTTGLVLLRAGTVAVWAAVLLRVEVRTERPRPRRSRVAVLFDTSASMRLQDAPTPSERPRPRYDRARAAWTPAVERDLQRRGFDLSLHGFDTEVRGLGATATDLFGAPPAGTSSNLAAALAAVAGATRPPSGLLVISDGRVFDPATRDALLDTAAALGVPISTVAAGAPYARDVWIAGVDAPPFAFAENVVDIDVEVAAAGYESVTVDVHLRAGGTILETRAITLDGSGVPRKVRFDVAPERVGSFVYTAEVEGPRDQSTKDNDRRAFVLKVLRDKVRVLHVAGRPDWDVRALRILLHRDPNVELLSYYILRDLDDILRDPTPPEDLSLIPFPTETLFAEELGSFDLVILQNFDLFRHQVDAYQDDLARYVRDGGGLVLIGGDLGLSEPGPFSKDYAGVLPIDLRRPSPFEVRPVQVTATPDGRTHPVTAALVRGIDGGVRLPRLSDRNRVRLAPHAASIDTRVLLEADGAPLLLAAEPGKGRVLVLATASSWRLGFAPDLGFIDGARPYDALWLGAVRWLLREEGSERLMVDTDRSTYAPADAVVVEATALGADYAPEADVRLEGVVRPLDEADGDEAAPVERFDLVTGPLGTARTVVRGLPPGAYAVEVVRAMDGGEPDRARRVFLVAPPRAELADVDARPGTAFLRSLAERTGGVFADLARRDPIPTTPPVRSAEARGPAVGRTTRLWDRPAMLLAALALLVAEVWTRRRRGFV